MTDDETDKFSMINVCKYSLGSWESGKSGNVCELNLRLGKSWKTWKIREFLSGQGFLHTLIVNVPSLSVHMLSNFLDLLKTAGKNAKKSGNFEKFSLENLEKSGNFYERSPERPDSNLLFDQFRP